MSRISVLGGTGYAGSAVVGEAVSRGHQVTSFSRHEPTDKISGVDYVIGSVLDPEVLQVSVTEHDVVIEAVSPRGDMAGEEERLVDRLIDLTSGTGTRLGVIGGASSLLVEEGGPRLYDVSEMPPPEVRQEIETGMATLEALKAAPPDVDWFYVSPPASFGAWVPAPVMGSYRLSEDVLLKDDAGHSTISAADLARAILDEIEQPRFHRRRFHVAH